MPWRKYTSRKGKYGPIYHIQNGIQVRLNSQKKWILFIEIDGKRKNKTIGSGREGLVKAIKAAEAISSQLAPNATLNTWSQAQQVQQGSHPNQDMLKFLDYSKCWLENNASRWDEQTYERYEGILRLHIWPDKRFDEELRKIGRKEIKMHLREIYKKRSPATVEAVHAVISGIFNEAIDDEELDANPATGLLKKILPPKKQRDEKDPAPFTMEERNLFLSQAEETCTRTEHMILKMMVHAGLRLGETLAVRLRNINFESKSYTVCESYKRRRFKKPKFGKTRVVDLPEFFMDELQNYVIHLKKEHLKGGRQALVDLLFLDPKEDYKFPYSQRRTQGIVKRVCTKAGLDPRNPHDLRHTYATILLMAHQSPAYVQKQLGHSSISITVDVYGHWIPGEGRKGLDEALSGAENGGNFVRKPHIFAYNKKRPQ